MKTSLPTFISILILFCGCSDDSSLHPDYFPLKKGQRIIYDQYAAEAPEDFSSLLQRKELSMCWAIPCMMGIDTLFSQMTIVILEPCEKKTALTMNEPIGVATMRDSRKKQSFSS
jgi:hypothetical protein